MKCIEKLSQGRLSELMLAPNPFTLLFTASWCGECMIMESMLYQLQKEFDPYLPIYKLDVEKEPDILGNFGVHTLPTLIIINKSRVVATFCGVAAKQVIRERMVVCLGENGPNGNHLG